MNRLYCVNNLYTIGRKQKIWVSINRDQIALEIKNNSRQRGGTTQHKIGTTTDKIGSFEQKLGHFIFF